MAAYEVLLLNTAIPQIQAAQSGDTYVVPRDIAFSAALTLSAGTANGVPYLNGSKVVTTGSALTFDGTNLATTGGVNSDNTSTLAKTAGQSLVVGNLAAAGAKLDVQTASGTASTLRLFQNGVSNFVLSVPANEDALAFLQYGSAELMRLTSTGLGIGTSSPGSFDAAADNLVVGTTSGNNGITIAAGTTGASTINFADGTAGGAQYAGYIDYQHSGDYMRFGTNGGTERMRLDSSGNLGLGVTPSAWGTLKALEIGGSGGSYVAAAGVVLYAGANNYYNGTNYIYKTTGAASQYQQIGGTHLWQTAPSGTAGNAISFTQIGTLDSFGLMIGRTGRQNNGTIEALGTGSQAFVAQVTNNANSNFQGFDSSGSATFFVTGSGAIYATSAVINVISDQALKENIVDIDEGLSKILQLKPRKFDWKDNKYSGKKNDRGFIAQEFEQVFPDLISKFEGGFKSVKPDLIPVLVKAIQELKAEFDAYKATHP